LEQVARETARMSYPSSMSRGPRQVVKKGAKRKIEVYFAAKFPLSALGADVGQVVGHYDAWHKHQTRALGSFLVDKQGLGNMRNDSLAVAAKLINTFMHQLMKYDQFRPLWPQLHLPLDGRIFRAFARIDSPAIRKIREHVGTKTAYMISYSEYELVQDTLWQFIAELNHRPGAEFQVTSRIELNYLWL